MQRVYLVPGFFGFANLGDVRYFGHVQRILEDRARAAGIEVVVHEVPTRPTASLRQRASRLLDTVLATSGPHDMLHLVGHSSGGLDARILVSPGTDLGHPGLAGVVERVASVVTVATPHRGTPSAAAFTTLAGKRWLRLLSLMTMVVVREGQLPLRLALRLVRAVRSLEGDLGADAGLVDELFTGLLDELSEERRLAIRGFFEDIGEDQALLTQITPDAVDLLGATLPDRPSVAYGSVVTRSRPPTLSALIRVGMSPQAQASLALYAACHRMARWHREPTWLGPDASAALARRWPDLDPTDNDGMVPTTSQPWGRVLAAADADHLDIIGHFAGSDLAPPHYDWIRTGTGFRRPHFEAVWADVGAFLYEAAMGMGRGR